ncbi:MAG: hypothetical protein GX591_18110 [Planctomycetes bacterium]|nr:hypothetical protein [Planctomycetota bacterium]
MNASENTPMAAGLKIGWAQADITPPRTVLVCGQFYARLSEAVLDPLTATALALEAGGEQAVLVSCDLVGVPDSLRDAVRARLGDAEALEAAKVVLFATHTHTGPQVKLPSWPVGISPQAVGVDLGVEIMDADAYEAFAAERIAGAVRAAWAARTPALAAYGHGWAVVSHNRRWVDTDGEATMYGDTTTATFSHIEGYTDHSVPVIATYDPSGRLTGLVVNVSCPSQCSEHEFAISADYWHETRAELRRRLGDGLFILPQCAAAGDQSPRVIHARRADQRMRELTGRSERDMIARRIADAVEDVLPALAPTADGSLPLAHHVETVGLPMNALTAADADAARAEAALCRAKYEAERARLDADPALRAAPRWYAPASAAYRMMRWHEMVAERFEAGAASAAQPVELHVIRLGELVLATNPFEFYLDFGIRIKARSPAVETLTVQLAGGGTYCPSGRSTAGGGYGSRAASNPVGPEGGRRLVERTLEVIQAMWT